ncbi:hypothetical protein [Paenibacillus sp. FSL H8-0332]|uniref:hypothetical protein n=1 Tax=Paenibacillus sp. FSL H8-0332 TaxID=2954742 RepID=UPI0030D3EAB0
MKIKNIVSVYATHSFLYGNGKIDKKEIISEIKRLNLNVALKTLSLLCCLPENDISIRNNYYNYLFANGREISWIKAKLDDKDLMSKQVLFSLWKWLLVYGNSDNNEENLQNIDYNTEMVRIITFGLTVADYLTNDTDIFTEYDTIPNFNFNSSINVRSSAARSAYLFLDLAEDKRLYKHKEYMEIHVDFESYYGFSIREFLSFLLGLIGTYNKDIKKEGGFLVIDLRRTLVEIKDTKKYKILELLTSTLLEAKEWAKGTIEEPWNYIKFQENPLIKINDNHLIPLSNKFLLENLEVELINKISKIYSGEKFFSFFGRIFEQYVIQFFEKSVELSKVKYELFHEFKYKIDGNKRASPDIHLKLGNKLLVIDAKKYVLRKKSYINAYEKSIKEDYKKIIVDSAMQINKRLFDLKSINHEMMNGVQEIYMLAVTYGNIPKINSMDLELEQEIRNAAEVPFVMFAQIDISEFEQLCSLLCRRRPIFRFLDKYQKMKPRTSFNNYLYLNKIPIHQMSFVKESFEKNLEKLESVF